MKSKNSIKRKSFILGVTMSLVASLNFVNAQCDNPAFTEGSDRSYAAGDIISRDGKDYKVKVAGWANNSSMDGAYAPGSGTNWGQAWDLENDPCLNTGGGGSGGGNGDGDCKRITIAIFNSGKIIITGGKTMEQLTISYDFLKSILKNKKKYMIK